MLAISLSEANNLVQTFNWHTPSWDLFILLAWIVGSVLYAFTAGRGRIINILISVYMAKLLVIEAPFLTDAITERLPDSVGSIQQLVVFLILFLVLFLFLGRYAFKTSADSKHLGSILYSVVFAILQIGLLINIILTFLPEGVKNSFSQLIQVVFIKEPSSFVWLLVPLAFLIVLGRHVADHHEI
jgi:hypothetical protein